MKHYNLKLASICFGFLNNKIRVLNLLSSLQIVLCYWKPRVITLTTRCHHSYSSYSRLFLSYTLIHHTHVCFYLTLLFITFMFVLHSYSSRLFLFNILIHHSHVCFCLHSYSSYSRFFFCIALLFIKFFCLTLIHQSRVFFVLHSSSSRLYLS
jgi:hypothetical protein